MRRILSIAVLAVATAACTGAPSPAPSAAPPPSSAAATPPASASPQPVVADPARIRIPQIGVDARVVKVGLKPVTNTGGKTEYHMVTPRFGVTGWYSPKEAAPPLARPGEPGPAVIVGHVDGRGQPDVFARLKDLPIGAEIIVDDERGQSYTFVAVRKKQTLKTALPAAEIWNKTIRPELRLITCTGEFNPRSGHYDSNLTVWAQQK